MSRITINDPDNMLTAKERAEIAKWERAKEASGWPGRLSDPARIEIFD